ncbi:helix-turn-helix domain-containing protein [Gryllotalpicola reticulitermitis]|uniref:Helix-turn-helix domain-containing protein n=1 Tax=Gryllotalpicola reticulitermitis TaxID=1184153 RepID=A0ABV8QB46_9MICO
MNQTRIGELRKAKGWTQERLAEASGIAVRTIQRLESGSDASLDTLARVAEVLGVQVTELFVTVNDSDYAAAVGGFERRTRDQQQRRDLIADTVRKSYLVLGVIVVLASIALIGAGVLPGIGIFIIPMYWLGGRVARDALLRFVIDPRLNARYPLSRQGI